MPDCTREDVDAVVDVELGADDVVVTVYIPIQYQDEAESSVEQFAPLAPKRVFHAYKFCSEICQCVISIRIGVGLPFC